MSLSRNYFRNVFITVKDLVYMKLNKKPKPRKEQGFCFHSFSSTSLLAVKSISFFTSIICVLIRWIC